MNKPAAFLALGEDISQLENAEATASEVTSHVLSQRLQLDEKAKTISLLQKAFVNRFLCLFIHFFLSKFFALYAYCHFLLFTMTEDNGWCYQY